MFIRFQVFIILLLAPFIGFFIANFNNNGLAINVNQLKFTSYEIQEQLKSISSEVNQLNIDVAKCFSYASTTNSLVEGIKNNASEDTLEYERQRNQLDKLMETSMSHTRRSEGVLDQILARMLGAPIGQTFGNNATIKIYSLQEAGYRGYMAKVRLLNPDAIRMILAQDQISSSGETTSEAAKRSNAILAVNAGGFQSQNGKIRPLGITVIDGEILTFSNSDLSVIGFNESGNLVGGSIESEEQLLQMGIVHGASFLPTLLKNGIKQPIPKEWANARHPRTLIGHFENGDLLFIVIDGRSEGWSTGVTLEEAQNKLLEFNVRDAYNLDGGGSSTFYYDGQILNRPSSGTARKVTTNIVIIP